MTGPNDIYAKLKARGNRTTAQTCEGCADADTVQAELRALFAAHPAWRAERLLGRATIEALKKGKLSDERS